MTEQNNTYTTTEKRKLRKAKKPAAIISKNFKLLPWEGKLKEAFGNVEANGNWLIKGDSGQGKTSFILQLANELSKHMKVLVNSPEEGDRMTMKEKLKKMKMFDGDFLVISEPLEDTLYRLDQRAAPRAIFIDSVQYTGISYDDYKRIKEKYGHKYLFIWISQVDGKILSGAAAKRMWFDVDFKLDVSGYRATSNGRYNPGAYFDIWPEKAAEFWGTKATD